MLLQAHLDEFAKQVAVCRNLRAHAVAALPDADARELLYESVLTRVFRAYENLIEGVFLSYLMGEGTLGGVNISRFAIPIDRTHARRMLQGASSYLDWSDPSVTRARCKDFLAADEPLANAITGRWDELGWLRRIRNHVSHNSDESLLQYHKVVSAVLLTLPSSVPRPGVFLQMTPTKGPLKGREVLAAFIEATEEIAVSATA